MVASTNLVAHDLYRCGDHVSRCLKLSYITQVSLATSVTSQRVSNYELANKEGLSFDLHTVIHWLTWSRLVTSITIRAR